MRRLHLWIGMFCLKIIVLWQIFGVIDTSDVVHMIKMRNFEYLDNNSFDKVILYGLEISSRAINFMRLQALLICMSEA